MTKNAIDTILALCVMFTIGGSVRVQAADDIAVSDELKFLLAQNQESFNRVNWVSYHSEQLYTDIRHGAATYQVAKDVVQKWPFHYIKCVTASRFPSHPADNYDRAVQSVLGLNYFAQRFALSDGSDQVDCYAHETVEQRSPRSINAEMVASSSEPLFEGSFGVDNFPIEDVFKRYSGPAFRVEIQDHNESGVHTFVVKHFSLNPAVADDGLASSITFAADKGYLITQYSVYGRLHLIRECSVQVNEIGPDKLPFPVSIVQTEYGQQVDPHEGLVWPVSATFHMAISNAVLRPDVKEEQFSMDALKLPEGAKIFYQSATGELEPRIWADGTIVPDLASSQPAVDKFGRTYWANESPTTPENAVRATSPLSMRVSLFARIGIAAAVSAGMFALVYFLSSKRAGNG